jgi:pyruvate dehydrogenase E2 component (dihydrolipoamide acetyltransferase)
MTTGTLAEWYCSAGDRFIAGDALCKIETDKASIDFEAQDDGYVAVLLHPAGLDQDIPVGVPIMVTVEEADHVAAFADYKVPVQAATPTAAPVAPSSPPPTVTAAAVTAPPKTAVAVAPTVVVSPPPPPPIAIVSRTTSSSSPAWGSNVSTTSPLAKTLAAAQHAYVKQYGSTGQRPIL